jgi:hypothetical protein
VRRRVVSSVSSVSAALLLLAFVSAAQTPLDRFTFERPIETAGAGARRLAVDVALLSGTQPSLADLRLFDASGAAVPHILLRSPVRQRQWTDSEVLPIAVTDRTSGFEADFQRLQTMDGVRVAGLRPPFLKRLVLEGSGDREHWTMLAAEGTLFDLPDQGLRQIEVAFPAGAYRYVRVTWDDRNSGRVPLPLGVQARLLTGVVPPPPLTARLSAERRGSEPGRSRYRVKLPAAHLPITAIDVIVPPDLHVFRQAFVRESRLSGMNVQPADLGRARLTQVAHDGVVAGAMRIPIDPPSEPEIDLVIEDGNNPPLAVSGVSIVLDELPWIYFEAPGGPIAARYGNPSATAPSFDLEAVRNGVHIEAVTDASWGAPRRLVPPPETAAAQPAVPDAGPFLDPNLFTVRRTIPGGPAGLVALLVDANALSHSRGPAGQFADLRIIDDSNRQVPYVIERRDEPMELPVTVEKRDPAVPETGSAAARVQSAYLVRLPYMDLPSAQLVVETSARVFQRAVELWVARRPDRNHRTTWRAVIARTTWSHVDDEAASALILPLPRVEGTEVWLSIDEGDNSPLPLRGARLLLPSYRVRFYRKPGAVLRLVYGRTDLAAPRYDLALLAPQVLGVETQEVTAAPASADDVSARGEFISRRTFWFFLSTAVLVLLGLIVRLARKEDAAPPPP